MRPRRILSIHSITGEPCNNFDGPAEPLARAMASANGYAVKEQIGYPTPGSLGSWAGGDLGIPVVTLELPVASRGAEAWQRNRSAILGIPHRAMTLAATGRTFSSPTRPDHASTVLADFSCKTDGGLFHRRWDASDVKSARVSHFRNQRPPRFRDSLTISAFRRLHRPGAYYVIPLGKGYRNGFHGTDSPTSRSRMRVGAEFWRVNLPRFGTGV